jgi:hypothetical protein
MSGWPSRDAPGVRKIAARFGFDLSTCSAYQQAASRDGMITGRASQFQHRGSAR